MVAFVVSVACLLSFCLSRGLSRASFISSIALFENLIIFFDFPLRFILGNEFLSLKPVSLISSHFSNIICLIFTLRCVFLANLYTTMWRCTIK